jgi:hypothetical protein
LTRFLFSREDFISPSARILAISFHEFLLVGGFLQRPELALKSLRMFPSSDSLPVHQIHLWIKSILRPNTNVFENVTKAQMIPPLPNVKLFPTFVLGLLQKVLTPQPPKTDTLLGHRMGSRDLNWPVSFQSLQTLPKRSTADPWETESLSLLSSGGENQPSHCLETYLICARTGYSINDPRGPCPSVRARSSPMGTSALLKCLQGTDHHWESV